MSKKPSLRFGNMLTVALIFFQGPFTHSFILHVYWVCLALLIGAKANPAVNKTNLCPYVVTV